MQTASGGGRNGLAILILGTALLVHALLLTVWIIPRGKGLDFFSIYLAARVPMTGQSPYKTGAINYEHPVFRDAARDYYKDLAGERPGATQLGLFYPPQAYLIFYPFTWLPWYPALACWSIFLTLAAVACWGITWAFDLESQGRSPTVEALVIAGFLLNPVTAYYFSMGQTTLLMCAGIALGQWARRAGYFWLAAFFWSFAMIKPQHGILLCALTLFAGGWRFCVATALMTLGLNVLGGLAMTGDPLMLLGLWKGGAMHIGLFANTAKASIVVSWIRVVYVFTGYEIAITPVRILAGFVLWTGLVLGAAWPRGGRCWALPYWLATATAGTLVFGLSHGYDLVMLILLVPYIFWLYDRGYRRDWIFLLALIAVASIPRSFATRINPGMLMEVLASHRAFVVLILAVYLLIRGQPAETCAPRAG
jgi:hypothetical protein